MLDPETHLTWIQATQGELEAYVAESGLYEF
jgi:hypothetical protein